MANDVFRLVCQGFSRLSLAVFQELVCTEAQDLSPERRAAVLEVGDEVQAFGPAALAGGAALLVAVVPLRCVFE